MMPIEAVDYNKSAWADLHKKRDRGALTGTSFEHIAKVYGLEGLPLRGMNVLEIGVGFGLCIKGFYERGCNVYALDICEEAFEVVKDYIKGSFLHENARQLPINFFDLIISHLVTQHISEMDILSQFPHVVRSLKPSGVLCVQFAYSDIPEENNLKKTIVGTPADGKVSMLGGRMVRTPEYAEGLIRQCGGKIVWISDMIRFPQFKSGWYYMTVVRMEA